MRALPRQIAIALRGGNHPRNVALAMFFGILAGFLTGWNFSLAAVLVLAAFFNVNTVAFVGAWAIGLGLAWLVEGASYRIGYVLLDTTPLGAWIGSLGDGLFVALLGWDRYTLIGGFPLALLIGAWTARLTTRLTGAMTLSNRHDSHDAPLDALSATRRRPRGRLAPRLVPAFICRPESGPAAYRLTRPMHMVWAVIVVGAVAGLTTRLGPVLIERELLSKLSALNGAEAAAAHVQLSLTTGKLVIDDLALADPWHLDHDRLQVGRVTAVVKPGPLVRGRIEIEQLTLEHIDCDIARRQAANAAGLHEPAEIGPTSDQPANKCHDFELDVFVRDWEQVCERALFVRRLVAAAEGIKKCELADASPGGSEASGKSNPMAMRRLRSQLGVRAPRVLLKQLRIEDLPGSCGFGRKSLIEMSQIASAPLDRPTRLKIVAPQFAAEFSAELNLHQTSPRHAVAFHALNVPLANLVDPNHADRILVIGGGEVDLSGEGTMDARGIEARIQIEVRKLDARVVSRERLAGLEPELWDDGLRRLAGLTAEVSLAGPWGSPAVTVNAHDLVEQFKHQLRAAGQHDLVDGIGMQLVQGNSVEASSGAGTSENCAEPIAENHEGTHDASVPTSTAGFFTISDQDSAAPAADGQFAERQRVQSLPPVAHRDLTRDDIAGSTGTAPNANERSNERLSDRQGFAPDQVLANGEQRGLDSYTDEELFGSAGSDSAQVSDNADSSWPGSQRADEGATENEEYATNDPGLAARDEQVDARDGQVDEPDGHDSQAPSFDAPQFGPRSRPDALSDGPSNFTSEGDAPRARSLPGPINMAVGPEHYLGPTHRDAIGTGVDYAGSCPVEQKSPNVFVRWTRSVGTKMSKILPKRRPKEPEVESDYPPRYGTTADSMYPQAKDVELKPAASPPWYRRMLR